MEERKGGVPVTPEEKRCINVLLTRAVTTKQHLAMIADVLYGILDPRIRYD